MSTWKHFGVILQHFGVILGYFGFTLSSLWRKLAEVGAKFGLSWPNLAPKSTLSWPKLVPSSSKLSPRWLQIGTSGHFGSILGSLWVTLRTLGGHFGVTLGVFRIILDDFGVNLKSFWVHEGYMGSILACFQKTLIFPIDFNDFINLRCQLGTTLGSFCSTLGSFWGTLVSLWAHFGASWPKLAPSWA